MGSDAWKDRQDEERRTGKGRVKKAFEKQKVINTASIDLVWSDVIYFRSIIFFVPF